MTHADVIYDQLNWASGYYEACIRHGISPEESREEIIALGISSEAADMLPEGQVRPRDLVV